MNVQFAVKEENGKPVVYVIEVNPRASRTVPFLSKVTGVPMVALATRCLMPAPAARPHSAEVVAKAVHDHLAAAEARVHEAERQLSEHGDKIDSSLKKEIEDAIAALEPAARVAAVQR